MFVQVFADSFIDLVATVVLVLDKYCQMYLNDLQSEHYQ